MDFRPLSRKTEVDPPLADVSTGSGFRINAPAKINLYLHLIGRRDDGYHLLDSLIAFAAIHDVVTVRPGDGLTLAVDGPFAPAMPDEGDNLVLRAARALQAKRGLNKGAAITLTKNLPVAAGVGGGSADAAAALLGLNALWELGATERELAELGLGLGADVPACLRGEPLYAAGIGEEIEPAPALPAMGLVLVNPNRPVSTAAVFSGFDGRFIDAGDAGDAGRFDSGFDHATSFAARLAERRNDLMAPACKIEPEIDAVLGALGDADGCLLSRLSGSGPTCFGLFESEVDASGAAENISAIHPGWWVRPTRFLARAETPVNAPKRP
jgi:4-diphosphocytidyl-2-C-methyl-D-erythritol kinase